MKKNGLMKKAMNSFMGRVLRRLAGEEKGAVMMEYIVIALLIAAAALVAVGVFGNTTSGMFATLTSYLTNQKEDGDATLTIVQTTARDAGRTAAGDHVNTVNQANTAVSDQTTW